MASISNQPIPMLDLALYTLLFLCTFGGLALLADLLHSLFRPRPATRTPRPGPRRTPRKLKPRPRPPVLVDGSNVVMWHKNAGLDTTARLDTLAEVLRQLEAEGQQPRVIFDATIGYNLEGRYLHEGELRRRLNRPDLSVLVVNKGQTADAALLAEAAQTGAPIVTNDRYRDHTRPRGLRLRQGHFDKGRIRLRA